MNDTVGTSSPRHRTFDGRSESTMTSTALESPPSILASSSHTATNSRQASVSPPSRHSSSPPLQTMHKPMLMEMSTSTSTSSIESSPFYQPSSRLLFHDTPTASQHPQLAELVSPTPVYHLHDEARTPTASGGVNAQDVFGKIDHTPLRQDTHSTSPLPNSRSLQMGDMLDHVLDAEQFSRLSVGNIIAPERSSSKKPKRLPTDPSSMIASPTPLPRSSARPRSALTSIAVNQSTDAAGGRGTADSPVSDPFVHRSHAPTEELSLHVKHHMAALQESPQTH